MEPDQNSDCEKCGAPISMDSGECPQCIRPKARKAAAAPVVLAVMVVLSSLLMLGTSVVNVATVPSAKVERLKEPTDMKQAAYEAAVAFIGQQHPNSKSFSEFNRSPVEQSGDQFTVTISSDDFSNPDNPVRNFFNVDVQYVSGTWKLKQIRQ